MTDGFPDRLTQLRNRWQADPSSRVFLQLAEEFRHLGRVREALDVLDAGLKEHPGYLSALVAKGRCHLELGESDLARTVLERVVQQDATQMVANKLLVRAYLEVGDVDRARQRLDLYSLLNDSDPEVEELRRRIAALNRPPQAAMETPRVDGLNEETPFKKPLDDSRASAPMPRIERMDEPRGADSLDATRPRFQRSDVFDLDHEPLPSRQKTDVFDLGMVTPALAQASLQPATASAPREDPFDLGPSSAERRIAEGHTANDDPFPDVAPAKLRQRYLASLTSEGIFSWDDVPAAPSAASYPVALEERAAIAPADTLIHEEPSEPLPEPEAHAAEPEEWAAPTSIFSHQTLAEETPDAAPEIAEAHEELPRIAEVSEVESPVLPEEPAAPAWSAAPEPLAALESVAQDEPPVLPSPVWEGRPQEPWAIEPDLPAVEPEPWIPPAAAPAEAPPLAADSAEGFGTESAPHLAAPTEHQSTATLGELYLRQGHVREAERIFRGILEREPDNVPVREALEKIGQSPTRELVPAHLLEGFNPDAVEGSAADLLRAKKVHFLNTYLERLRQADQPHVS